MIKYITKFIKSAIEAKTAQARISALIGQSKKSDYIKINLPKKYVSMVEVLAMHGIESSEELYSILAKKK